MKLFIASLLLVLIPTFAQADCSTQVTEEQVVDQLEIKTDVPKYLEGATITVKLADGRESTVPAEQFKVVPRKQQFITTKTIAAHIKTCNSPERNRVSVIGGRGAQSGINRDDSKAPTEVSVENRVGTVLGLQYQYRTDVKVFNMPLSVGAQGQDNKTGSLLLGVDF